MTQEPEDLAESPTPEGVDVLTVSALTASIQETLESRFPEVWVEGEISNLAKPRSGHLYFSLKDPGASLRAVLFKFAAGRLGFDPKEGEKVLAFGALSVYPPRGDYQMRVLRLVRQGTGALQLAFEKLKARLEAEGLFAPERKRRLPFLPHRIGLVTSPSGAALHDVMRILRRRAPGIEVVLAPTRVQGAGSALEIAAALDRIQEVPGLDLVILARGGGSLEDLWAFNEEPVARAIFRSRIPVVSGVGHEVDVTIADLVADLRAPTPSGAAELVVPETRELARRIDRLARRLLAAARSRVHRDADRLRRSVSRRAFRDPAYLLELRAQRVDELLGRIRRSLSNRLRLSRGRLEGAVQRLLALGPESVLRRGYAVLTREGDPRPLTDSRGVEAGTRLRARLAVGSLECEVVAGFDPEGVPLGGRGVRSGTPTRRSRGRRRADDPGQARLGFQTEEESCEEPA